MELGDDPAWLFEAKYDGYRGLLLRHAPRLPLPRGTILKRIEELVLLGFGKSCWQEGNPLKDLRRLPLTRRKLALMGLVPATTTVVSQVFSIEERGKDLFAAAERLGLEGIVAKRKVDPYVPETVCGTRSRTGRTFA